MPVKHAGVEASPFVRLWLARGEMPAGRLRGWVHAMMTGGRDNRPIDELLARYGDALRNECAAAGFVPECDLPLTKQSRAAQRAAQHWAGRVIVEGTY